MKIIAIYNINFFSSIGDIYDYIDFIGCDCLVWKGDYLIEFDKNI